MQTIQNGDFIELEYTGWLTDEKQVIDTTSAEVAKANKVFDEHAAYKPSVICLAEGHIPKGLDLQLVGVDVGKQYKFELEPEDAFGKKSAKLIQLIPTTNFFNDKINPVPGLRVNVDGLIGVVRTVTGGRTLVDFNHPFAGKRITYDAKVLRIIADDLEKVNALAGIMGLELKAELKDSGLVIRGLDNPEARERLGQDIPRLISSIKTVSFES